MTEPIIKYVLLAYVDGTIVYSGEADSTAELDVCMDYAEEAVEDKITGSIE